MHGRLSATWQIAVRVPGVGYGKEQRAMAKTYGEWRQGNSGTRADYENYLQKQAMAARQVNAAAVIETSDVWVKVLGHYDIKEGRLYCLLDSTLLDYVGDGDTLLTLAVKAFEHEKGHYA